MPSGIYIRTKKHKEILSKAMKGEKNPFFGQKHTEKSIGEMKGNQNALGSIRSETTRKKMSEGLKGENNGNFGKKGILSPSWKGGWKNSLPNCEICSKRLSSRKAKICSDCFKGSNWKGGISTGENRKEYVRFKGLERISKKKKAKGSHTLQEWQDLKEKYNFMCLCCKRFEPEIKLSEDHIIPLSLDGSNSIENIQPLCRSCNSRKWKRIIKYRL